MEYRFAAESPNYTDLASGRVFYSLPGHPAFPIRLASEIFQRCLALRGKGYSPCTLFDPCCGAAYHLSVIAYLHWDLVRQVIGSDIDEKAVQLAGRNLSLLTLEGMERRSQEISAMLHLYGKTSHSDALESLYQMRENVNCLTAIRPMHTKIFQANATDVSALKAGLQGVEIDIVFTDIPYGQHSHWLDVSSPNPVWSMLETLLEVLASESIVAVASDKQQKIAHEAYQRLEKLQVGKRQVIFLKPFS